MKKVVIDTNVFISALLGKEGSYARIILDAVFDGNLLPLMGNALFNEYSNVLNRNELFKKCPLDEGERSVLFASFLSCCKWTKIYFKWRPNLKDESDNHIVELAVAGGAKRIITDNTKDFVSSELCFSGLEVITPKIFLKEAKWEQLQ